MSLVPHSLGDRVAAGGPNTLSPAFVFYLAALASLGFKWLSPIEFVHERAVWSDLFIAASAALWAFERIRHGSLPRWRLFHLGLVLFLAATALSAAFAVDQGTAAVNLLLTAELVALAQLTSEFASNRARRNLIVWVIALVAFGSAALAAIGLALFFSGTDTSLIGPYGEQFIASDRYARVAAGFHSPPLLASFCIFASAVVARADSSLPGWLRATAQAALGALVLVTFSRGAIAFAAAVVIRTAYRRDSRRLRIAALAVVLGSVTVIAALTVGRVHFDPTRPSTLTYEVPDPYNRREALVTSVDTLSEHPVLGSGPGSLPGENRGDPFRAHLTPLNVAATLGLPALAAVAFLGVVLWRNRRRPTPIATWSGMAGLGIDGLAQDIEHFRHVWVMIGIADADRRPSIGAVSRRSETPT